MLGYKHTKQAIAKMKARFLNKQNHPMFGKTHNEVTKQLMSIKKSMIPLGLYDENNYFIEKFSNQVELANKFGVHKTTSGFAEPSILKQVNFLKINFTRHRREKN